MKPATMLLALPVTLSIELPLADTPDLPDPRTHVRLWMMPAWHEIFMYASSLTTPSKAWDTIRTFFKFDYRGELNECVVCSTQSLAMGAEGRQPLFQRQQAHGGGAVRARVAGRRASAAAVFAGHAEREKGRHHAGRVAGKGHCRGRI